MVSKMDGAFREIICIDCNKILGFTNQSYLIKAIRVCVECYFKRREIKP